MIYFLLNSNICEDIKVEIKEEETEKSNICEDIKEEVEEEESVDDSSFNQQELGNVSLDCSLYLKSEKIEWR